MTNAPNYKSNAKNVRSEARDILLAYRRERAEKKKAARSSGGSEPLVEVSEVTPIEEDHTPEVEDLRSDFLSAFSEETAADIKSALEDADLTLIEDVPEEIQEIIESGDLVNESPAAPNYDRESDEIMQTDLATLPGAGPGLVWMLHENGIKCLPDLAKADVAELKAGLGLIGQILNVQAWIDFAKRSSKNG